MQCTNVPPRERCTPASPDTRRLSRFAHSSAAAAPRPLCKLDITGVRKHVCGGVRRPSPVTSEVEA
ncbi:hypothetical protein EON66_07060 [archaeon]|nr:MAG: hypothetical protein EON66_07060 [archaeon]